MKHFAELLQASKSTLIRAIDELTGQNAERDRRILYRKLIDGLTFERLAEEFQLSPNHVQRVVYMRERELLRYLDR